MHRIALALLLVVACVAAGEEAVEAVTKAAKANVRFGPSLDAKIVASVPAGSRLQVLGKAPGKEGWFVVRFPQQGRAWVSANKLEAVEDGKQPEEPGKRYRSREEKIRVRDDATPGGNIVTELQQGEEVICQGPSVNGWMPVYAPSAIAYVNGAVGLQFANAAVAVAQGPNPNPGQANPGQGHPGEQAPAKVKGEEVLVIRDKERDRIERVWKHARGVFLDWHAKLKGVGVMEALAYDWEGLGGYFADVRDNHREIGTKLEASRTKDVIDNVVRVQRAKGIQPKAQVPPVPAEAPAIQQPVAQPPAQPQPRPETPQPTTPPAPATTDAQVRELIDVGAQQASKLQAKMHVVEGYLESRDFAKVGAEHVIIDDRSNVVAFLKAKPGSSIQLNEYFWRRVGVKGDVQQVDQAAHDLGRPVPLILVEQVDLLR